MRLGRTALLLFALSCSACTRTSSDPLRSQPLRFPTKDDVALVEGVPLSIAAFLSVRQQLKAATKENAFWASVASAVLNQRSIPAQNALEIARYALGDLDRAAAEPSLKLFWKDSVPSAQQARQELDQLISQLTVQRNVQVLAGL